jgi:hypothetical protein
MQFALVYEEDGIEKRGKREKKRKKGEETMQSRFGWFFEIFTCKNLF